MLNGVIAHISACSAPTGTRNNLQGTRSRARICKIAAPIVRLFSYILTFLPLSMRATTVSTLPSPRLKGDTTRACAKNTFLKIPISFTPLIPCLLPPREEREKTERTAAQLPANKKCCLLIFAIAIGCLVLADFPTSSLPVALVHPVLPFPFLLVSCSAGAPITLVASWGALCGSAREKSALLNEKSP